MRRLVVSRKRVQVRGKRSKRSSSSKKQRADEETVRALMPCYVAICSGGWAADGLCG